MEEVFIKGIAYTFIKNLKDDNKLRASFNKLTQYTFGFDFEDWYQSGYWGENYIPYSLLDGEKVVANVSVSTMEFHHLGEIKKYVQIGTVMTDTNYRNNGLSKYLMERVLDEYKDKVENIYLYANDSVLEFYPQFGFSASYEYVYSKNIMCSNKNITIDKLDMSLLEDREVFINKIVNAKPVSKLAMINNTGLIMFYCNSFFSNNIYYLKEDDIIVIAEFEYETLSLIDVFSDREVDLDSIVNSLCNENINKVVLGFTPKNTVGYDIARINNEDTTLFILKENKEFTDNKLMFPILSHT